MIRGPSVSWKEQPAMADPSPVRGPVVQADGISKRFGATVALADARLTVAPGESHALVGRNGAGKSTLVSILTGLQQADTGTLRFDGEPAPAPGDTDAWRARVACVYQRSTIIPALTVAENLFLDRQVEQRQFVEIARALSFGARFIILDEPTAKLDARGIERLFAKLRELQDQGVAFLFISHHLQEVYELCTTVTVYRDARHILTAPVAELGHQALVEAMTGEAAQGTEPAWSVAGRGAATGEPLLEAAGLSLPGAFEDFSLTARAGEVVGLAGSAASGNVQLGETLAGLHRPQAGTVTVAGRAVRTGRVPAALAAGIGFVPEDRHLQGLIPQRSVAENATLTVSDQLGPWGTVLPSRTRAFAERMITGLDIKTPGPATPVSALSGGNQQKVVIARALAAEPHVLVAVRPTNGVDIKSKEALLGTIRQVADSGRTALVVSDELDDLRACDRVLAMFRGRIVAEFAPGWRDEQLVAAMEGMTGPNDPKDSHVSHH
jgi:simple sugar transport system ATP-binding protein